MDKLCKDCKWCSVDFENNYEFAKCNYYKLNGVDLITGKKKKITQNWSYCDVLRGSTVYFIDFIFAYIAGICGPQGRFWRRKANKQ